MRRVWDQENMLSYATHWLTRTPYSPQNEAYIEVSWVKAYQGHEHYQQTDGDSPLLLLEFYEPLLPGFSGEDSYSQILRRLQQKEQLQAEAITQQLLASYQAIRDGKQTLEQLKRENKVNDALLGALMKHLQLRVVPFPYASLAQTHLVNLSERPGQQEPPFMAGSYHISITMPKIQQNPDLEDKQALYAAYVLQWLEPLFVAVAGGGDPTKPLNEGIQGSYRLQNNTYSTAGTTPLKWCASETGDLRDCIGLKYQNIGHARSGLSQQCYMNLIWGGDVERYTYHGIEVPIDFKGKGGRDHVANVATYRDGFELRIFDNMKIERFLPNIQLFSLAIAHAQTTLSAFDKSKQYVNLFDPDANQSPPQCGPCTDSDYSIPCNQWQVAMASVLQRGYRARLSMAFIDALEKNLSLTFWHNPNTTHAYAFEVADALSSELQRRYGKNPLLVALLGGPLDAKPQLAKMGLEEWASYFTAPDQAWHANWQALLREASRSTHHKTWTRQSFIAHVVMRHFDWDWTSSYDDILFLLEHLGKIKLSTHNGEIVSIH
jgi:hypothetical protein